MKPERVVLRCDNCGAIVPTALFPRAQRITLCADCLRAGLDALSGSTAPIAAQLRAQPDLGKVPDVEIARRLGCAPQEVFTARSRLGIPAAVAGRRLAEDPELHTARAVVLAERYGLTRRRVYQIRREARCARTWPGDAPAPDRCRGSA